jgi:hypothetical protein
MAPSRASAVREGGGEASVGVHAGGAMEPRINEVRGADAVESGGRQHRCQRYARAGSGSRAVEEPRHVWSLRAREPGDLMAARLTSAIRRNSCLSSSERESHGRVRSTGGNGSPFGPVCAAIGLIGDSSVSGGTIPSSYEFNGGTSDPCIIS